MASGISGTLDILKQLLKAIGSWNNNKLTADPILQRSKNHCHYFSMLDDFQRALDRSWSKQELKDLRAILEQIEVCLEGLAIFIRCLVEGSTTLNIIYCREDLHDEAESLGDFLKLSQLATGLILQKLQKQPLEPMFSLRECFSELRGILNLRKSLVDQNSLHHQLCIRRAPETCQWLLNSDSFKNWLGNSDRTVFWLQGKTGMGKSILT